MGYIEKEVTDTIYGMFLSIGNGDFPKVAKIEGYLITLNSDLVWGLLDSEGKPLAEIYNAEETYYDAAIAFSSLILGDIARKI